MRPWRRVRAGALAACLMLGGALAGTAAYAVEPSPGTRNFTAPSSVPNYFSDESAPFRGGRSAQPGADQFNAAPGPSGGHATASRRHTRNASASAARAKQRGKLTRAKLQRTKLARGKAAASRRMARASALRGGKAVAARRAAKPAAGKKIAASTRTAASHGTQVPRSAR